MSKTRPNRQVEVAVNAALQGVKFAMNQQTAPRIPSRQELFGGQFSGSSYGYYLTGHYPAADYKRHLWEQAGYPDTVLPFMLFNMYRRNGLARAAANLKVDKTWQTPPTVYDGDCDPERREEKPTAFEQAFDSFAENIKLWKRLHTADRFQRVMRYSGVVIVCREMEKGTPADDLTRVAGPDAVLDLKPVYETQIEITEAYQDITSENYGQPKYYNFRAETPGSRNPWETDQYILSTSRVISFAEDAADDSPYGVSCLEAPFNAILDAEKTRMASAEGYYKNAKQRAVIAYDTSDNQGMSSEMMDTMTEAINDEARDFNAMLGVGGANVHSLQSTLADPTNPWTIAVNEIAASEGYPVTILIGQQTGRLASDEDQSHFGQLIMSRRNNFATDMVMKVIERMQEINALPPATGEITVEWDDLTATTQDEKFDMGKKMAETNKTLRDAQMEPAYSQAEIREISGLSAEKEADLLPEPKEGEDDLPALEA